MSNAHSPKILAPYGALKFAALSTKVGVIRPKDAPFNPLAPYGALKFAALSTKIGPGPKDQKVPSKA
jgi:hypothetical protein